MGLFDLFRSDPAADLTKAERMLDDGDAVRALERARKVRNKATDDDDLRARADALVDRAQTQLRTRALETADERESNELFEEAADWLDIAMSHARDDAEREAFDARRTALLARAEEARERAARLAEASDRGVGEDDDDLPVIDLDAHYDTLVDMLTPEVGARYADRPAAFRTAWLQLNEGEAEPAEPVFEALAAETPDDPVLRLERGRCRMLLGRPADAIDDLAHAWEALGDAPLDRAGTLTAPLLWAEAQLAAGDPASVVTKLADRVDPDRDDAALLLAYAGALGRVDRLEDAQTVLARAARRFPGQPQVIRSLAETLGARGHYAEAIDRIETALAPPGDGRPAPKHPILVATLVALHLARAAKAGDSGDDADGGDAGDVDALPAVAKALDRLLQARQGVLLASDHRLAARYHQLAGDADAAAEALALAEDALDDPDGVAATLSPQAGQQRAIL